MADRIGTADRQTAEGKIEVHMDLDPEGTLITQISISAEKREPGIEVAVGEHFFQQIHRFSGFGGTIVAHGDLPHHVLEDVGICWGQAFKKALGDRVGIRRTECHIMPMEGVLVTVAVDISGRPYAAVNFKSIQNSSVIEMAEMIKHILTSIAMHGMFDLYVKVETVGDLSIQLVHHALETVAKALGRVLRDATRIEGTEILSTKGVL